MPYANPEEQKAYLKEYLRKYYLKNREKMNAQGKQWRAKNHEKQIAYGKKNYADNREKINENSRRNRLKKYGISVEEFAAMAEAQEYKCGICGTDSPGGKGSWRVDHCHKSGVVRELLCIKCNSTLGFVDDDVELLQKMIEYVKKHKVGGNQ